MLGHRNPQTTKSHYLEPSGIALDDRETAGRQVTMASEWRFRPVCGSALTSADQQAIPFDAGSAR
jgi:hypothetical protein